MTFRPLLALAAIAVAATATVSVAAAPKPQPPTPKPPTPQPAAAPPASGAAVDGIVPNSTACFDRFKVVGLPAARSDADDPSAGPFCRRGYALRWNSETRNPDWVMEHLNKSDLKGTANRNGSKFQADTPFLKDKAVKPSDYDGKGFDRGHQAPAGDDKFNQAAMNDTFYMSNMAPQVGLKFNRGEWRLLEESIRAAVLCGGHDDIYLVTGPIYDKPSRFMKSTPIRVPDAFFKIAYDPTANRAVGYILRNQAYENQDPGKFAVPITQIESATGFVFLPKLPQRDQNVLKSSAGVAWGHSTGCSGVAD